MWSTCRLLKVHNELKLPLQLGSNFLCTAPRQEKPSWLILPEYQVNEILAKEMVKYTEHTLVSLADLYQDLHETRERGFAISKEEYEKDINAVAAPILDANSCPIAVIAIVGPSFRLSHDRMMKLGQSILETTSTIAREIGLAALPVILPKTTNTCNDKIS